MMKPYVICHMMASTGAKAWPLCSTALRTVTVRRLCCICKACSGWRERIRCGCDTRNNREWIDRNRNNFIRM